MKYISFLEFFFGGKNNKVSYIIKWREYHPLSKVFYTLKKIPQKKDCIIHEIIICFVN